VIEAHGLTKRYGHHTAIEDISFSVEKGEILGFLGPNGAGKTTTMRILTGYLPPNEGNASIAGHDILTDSLRVREHLGYLPENVPLYTEMTVAGYLDYMARLRHLSDRRHAIQRAMESVHIEDRANVPIGKLSKGYRQRVGLAQALLHDPPVLILDEPTVGLDPRQIIEVRELIRSLGEERTVILSTHILPEVSELCGRVVILNNGRMVAVDTLDALTKRLQADDYLYLKVTNAQNGVEEKIRSLDGVVDLLSKGQGRFEVQCEPDKNIGPRLAKLVVEQGWELQELRATSLSMEEIFLKLTAHQDDDEDTLDEADDDVEEVDETDEVDEMEESDKNNEENSNKKHKNG
jgi:ABC-2 type transport system ATP-binding protein